MTDKTVEIHEAYLQCKEVFKPSRVLFKEIVNIEDTEERLFYETLTNFFLQQRQKEIVEKGKY